MVALEDLVAFVGALVDFLDGEAMVADLDDREVDVDGDEDDADELWTKF